MGNMMNFELEKICRKYQINRNQLTPEDVTKHPEEVQGRLKTALGCVKAAEKTLEDFKEYLKDDKYKSWNAEQKQRSEEALKTMIGEMPQGTHTRNQERMRINPMTTVSSWQQMKKNNSNIQLFV